MVPVGNGTAATLPGLHNVFHLSAKLYTGAAPEGEAGFRSLEQLGIRTILTVDGAPPDVARAKRYGMRYVHLPFGYDGCPVPRATEIVRAVRDLPGPVYLHCHHGQHRSPTAAAFARIALDRISNEQAVREMERAGTGKEYAGLYAEVRAYRPPPKAEIDSAPADFPEVAPAPPLVVAMVQAQARFDRLSAASKNGWRAPSQRADAQPAYEALQLRELFTELSRTRQGAPRPADFRHRMRDAEADAAALEAALRAGHAAGPLLIHLSATCASCHAKYRNVPQGMTR